MTSILLIGASGYVGAYLRDALRSDGRKVTTVDVRPDAIGGQPDFLTSHVDLTDEIVHEHDVVLFFAGCSSVAAAEAGPSLALRQNALELLGLASRLASQQRLIYASSASVYSHPLSVVGEAACEVSAENSKPARPANAYDASKAACDILMPLTGAKSTGLRMGTVSGFSVSLRPELVFNAMVSLASEQEAILVRNPNAWRSLLHLADLANIVRALVDSTVELPSLVNVGSINIRIGELARRLGRLFDVPVVELPDSATYSFALDTAIARSFAAPVDVSLEEHALQFVRDRDESRYG